MQVSFRVNVHGSPTSSDLKATTIDGRSVRVHSMEANTPPALGLNFDTVIDSLSALERTHVELDGSFVHRTPDNCQIDGMIYDLGGVVQYVELLGRSDRLTWCRIIRVICGENVRVSLQDLAYGVMIPIDEFEEWRWPDGI